MDAQSTAPTAPKRPNLGVRWALVALFSLALILFDPVAGLISSSAGTGSQTVPDPATVPSPMLEMQARYALGVEQLTGQSMADAPFAPTPERYVEMAGNQIERVRVVVLIHDMFGPDEALQEIDALRAEYEEKADQELDDSLAEDLAILEKIATGDGATDAERVRLIDRHGLFGELAVAQIENDDEAAQLRVQLEESARTLALTVFAFGGIVGVMMLLGLLLLVILSAFFAAGLLKTVFSQEIRRTPSHEYNWVMVETAALFLGGFFAIKLVGTLLAGVIPPAVSLGGQFALAALILWPVVRIGSMKKASALMGWTRGKGVFNEIGAALLAYVAGLPVVAVGLLVALVLITLFDVVPSHPVTESLPSGGTLEIVLLYCLACVWAPIVEESVFRGAFYRAMRVDMGGFLGAAFASLVTSFVFAAIHPQGILFVPALMGLAIVFAFMREWRGSLIAPMLAHALHNACIVTFALVLFSS